VNGVVPSIVRTGGGMLVAAALGLLPACGPIVVDHTPQGNILDADTEDLEGGLGHWQAWYSTDLSRSTSGARRGRASLRIEITASDGWGVQLNNWPGFEAAPGPHRIELWARLADGSALDLEASVHWRDDAGKDLDSSVVTARPDRNWQRFGSDLVAPVGTIRVWVEITGSEGGPGDALEVDEIFVL
jgi:hypothetical protein